MITSLQIVELPGWTGLKLSGRVDAFNDRQIIESIKELVKDSTRVAFELSDCECLNLKFLKYLSTLKEELGEKGGELALVRPNTAVDRQIDIFLGAQSFRTGNGLKARVLLRSRPAYAKQDLN